MGGEEAPRGYNKILDEEGGCKGMMEMEGKACLQQEERNQTSSLLTQAMGEEDGEK